MLFLLQPYSQNQGVQLHLEGVFFYPDEGDTQHFPGDSGEAKSTQVSQQGKVSTAIRWTWLLTVVSNICF